MCNCINKSAFKEDSPIEIKRIDWVWREGVYFLVNGEWVDKKDYVGDYRDVEGIMTNSSIYSVDIK